jgi:hypothetical protein
VAAPREPEARTALGADLVIPLLALAFAGYFFVSIYDLAWEAKANGLMIGAVLVLLVVMQIARIAIDVVHRRGNLSTAPLWEPRDALAKRLALVAITIAFIATIKWLGLTLGLLIGMLASLWVMGVRGPKPLIAVSVVVAAAAYGLFIAALNSEFPHGPVEHGLAALFGR